MEIAIYNFNKNQVRTQTIDGEPWFCLADCRKALTIKGSLKTGTLTAKGVTKSYSLTAGGNQELAFINEPNLYRLIFRSNKPQAQAFADWVYSEVLPSIRKTGKYAVAAPKENLPVEAELKPEAMKALGGMVKRCCAAAVREELEKLLADTNGKKADYEVSDRDLLLYLNRWHNTRSKADTERFRELNAENYRLTQENQLLRETFSGINKLLKLPAK